MPDFCLHGEFHLKVGRFAADHTLNGLPHLTRGCFPSRGFPLALAHVIDMSVRSRTPNL